MQALFQSDEHLYEKKEGAGAVSIPLTNRAGFRSPTLQEGLELQIRRRIVWHTFGLCVKLLPFLIFENLLKVIFSMVCMLSQVEKSAASVRFIRGSKREIYEQPHGVGL